MTLILRKCWKNGSSSYDPNFKYGQVGDRVTCPDWEPNPKCGNGLHGLKNGIGDWSLLKGDDWLVIDADDQVVDIDNEKCKFNTGIILFRGTAEELSETDFCHKMVKNSEGAYYWALNIGNQDIMIDRITDSQYAYLWAIEIGNHDIMKPKITYPSYIKIWNKSFPDNQIAA